MKISLGNNAITDRSFATTELSITLFVLLSYTVQIFSHVLKSNTLLIIVLFILGLLILSFNFRSSKKICPRVLMISLITIVVSAINMIRPSLSNELSINKYVILFVFFAGFSLIVFSEAQRRDFDTSVKIIIAFSIFYAFSVWFQILFPESYRVFLKMMPVPAQGRIISFASKETYYTGFTHNPGITAGYIVTGMMMLGANYKRISTNKIINILPFIFLTISLFMTGKRAHVVFIMVALFAGYILPYKKREFSKRLLAAIFMTLIIIVLLFSLWDFFSEVPVFGRVYESLTQYAEGADITSGRSSLYEHAWKQFLNNPLFGIGWGNFRYTVIGTVTKDTQFEVHNVYLQLLCETGITGFLLIVIPMIAIFITTMHHIRKLKNGDRDSWFSLLSYSLMYQVFFLFYSLTENPLYNPSYLMMYIFSILIILSFIRHVRVIGRPNYATLQNVFEVSIA